MTDLNINSFARIELSALGEQIIKGSSLDVEIDENHCIVLPIIKIIKIFGPYISQLHDLQLFNNNLELPTISSYYNINSLTKVFLNNDGLNIIMKINQFLVKDCLTNGVKPTCIPLEGDCSVTLPLVDIMKIFGIHISDLDNKTKIPFDFNIKVFEDDIVPITRKKLRKINE